MGQSRISPAPGFLLLCLRDPLSGAPSIPWEGTSSAPPLPSQASLWNSSLLSILSPLEGSSSLCNAPTAHSPPPNPTSRAPPPTLAPRGGHGCPWGALEPSASQKKGTNSSFHLYILQNPAGKSVQGVKASIAMQLRPELVANSIHPIKK